MNEGKYRQGGRGSWGRDSNEGQERSVDWQSELPEDWGDPQQRNAGSEEWWDPYDERFASGQDAGQWQGNPWQGNQGQRGGDERYRGGSESGGRGQWGQGGEGRYGGGQRRHEEGGYGQGGPGPQGGYGQQGSYGQERGRQGGYGGGYGDTGTFAEREQRGRRWGSRQDQSSAYGEGRYGEDNYGEQRESGWRSGQQDYGEGRYGPEQWHEPGRKFGSGRSDTGGSQGYGERSGQWRGRGGQGNEGFRGAGSAWTGIGGEEYRDRPGGGGRASGSPSGTGIYGSDNDFESGYRDEDAYSQFTGARERLDLTRSRDASPGKRVPPKGYQRSDERIREDVCERLSHSSGLDVSEVEVTVMQGIVTLSGTVNDRRQKYRMED